MGTRYAVHMLAVTVYVPTLPAALPVGNFWQGSSVVPPLPAGIQ